MCCPYLQEAEISICHAKPGAMMSPNEYEFNYHCLTRRYEECLLYKRYHREGENDELHWGRKAKI